MNFVYLDNNATTKVDGEVLEAMLPFLTKFYGNPSSIHSVGEIVSDRIREAREEVASFLGAQTDEIIFTSCGSESNNTAIKSAIQSFPDKKHIITTTVEHPAVYTLCNDFEKKGFKITRLLVDENGNLNISQLEDAIDDNTCLVSIMWVNNETGVIFPIKEIADIVKSKGVLFHCDAVQAVGKIPINLAEVPIDFLSISGHKLHAPKGIGALFVRRGIDFYPLIRGGHQEFGKRAGTENTPYIIGLGKACELANKHLDFYNTEVRGLRDKLEDRILKKVPNTMINGHKAKRVANTSSISFQNVEGEAVLLHINEQGIAASTGSACASGSVEPSRILIAMGLSEIVAHGTLRFSLSRFNTEEQIDHIILQLPPIIEKLRRISPFK